MGEFPFHAVLQHGFQLGRDPFIPAAEKLFPDCQLEILHMQPDKPPGLHLTLRYIVRQEGEACFLFHQGTEQADASDLQDRL